MLKKILNWVKTKLVTILASTTAILFLSLMFVSWQYVGSIEEISSLKGDKISLERRVIACGEELRTAITIRGDVESTFEETSEELSESRSEFDDLRKKLRELEKRQCTDASGNNETVQDTTATDPVIDEYYRLLFRAHCLSTGTGSCDSSGDVFR